MFTILVLQYVNKKYYNIEHNAIVSGWTQSPQQCIPETIQNSRTPTTAV